MSTVLYRKYRARTFAEIRGQEVVTTVLRNSILADKISHAYLFSGPRGTGKTSLARLLAIAVNSPDFKTTQDIDPESEVSKSIEQGKYLDLVEIDAASNRGIEEIRQLKEGVNYRPSQGKYKVYIIDEVHMLTREAFNALLKTLEEPPKHAIFILATTEPQKVPDTILSRVQRFDFRPATEAELLNKLEHIISQEGLKADTQALVMLHKYSGGSYRDAESVLGKLLLGKSKGEVLTVEDIQGILGLAPEAAVETLIDFLLSGQILEAQGIIQQVVDAGVDVRRFSEQVIRRLRENIMQNLKAGKDYSRLVGILRKLIQAQSEYRLVDDPQVILELAIYELQDKPLKTVEKPTPVEKEPSQKSTKVMAESIDTVQKIVSIPNKLQDTKWNQFLTSVKKFDMKVWVHLKGSHYEYRDSKLILLTKFNRSLSELTMESTYNLLKSNIKAIFGSDTELIIELDAGLDESLKTNESLVESMF
jgi:DNA polymerase-3 subunit gamma/tau